MQKKLLIIASVLGCMAVVLGAMGTHGLKPVLSESQFYSFETAIKYQIYHTIVLFITVLLSERLHPKLFKVAVWLFITGMFFFSGSIYLLSTRELTGLTSISWLGPVTPLGGLLLISGWICLALGAWKNKN